MAQSVDLAVRIAVDAANAGKQIEQVASGASKFQEKVSKLAVPAAAAGAAIIAFGKGAVDSASATQQALGAVGSVFGSNASQVTAWSENAAQSAGLAQSSYLEMASKIGAQLNNMGVSSDEATAGTDKLITMGADLAATFGGSTADAVDALGAAMKGEADSAEKYGLNLSASAVAAQMAADGTDKLQGAAFTAAKAQTVMALATKQSGAAVGAFARESDTAEGASARASATWENTQATLGQILLPAVTAVSTALGAMAKFMGDNAAVAQIAIGVLGLVAAAILAVSVATKVYAAGQAIAAAATWLWNAALAANPVMLVVIGIVALVAAVVILWNKCEGFRNVMLTIWKQIAAAGATAWKAIQAVVAAVVNAIKSAMTGAGAFISGVWNAVRSAAASVWNAIRSTVAGVVSGIVAVVRSITGAVSSVWNAIRSAASTAFNGIKAVVQGVVTAIGGFFQRLGTAIGAVWDTIMAAGQAIWGPIQSAAESAMSVISGIIDGISGAIDAVFGTLRDVAGFVSGLWDKITGANKAAAAIPAPKAAGVTGFAAASPSLLGVMPRTVAAATTAATSGSTIVVNGALFPDDAARAVQSVLRRQARRQAGAFL